HHCQPGRLRAGQGGLQLGAVGGGGHFRIASNGGQGEGGAVIAGAVGVPGQERRGDRRVQGGPLGHTAMIAGGDGQSTDKGGLQRIVGVVAAAGAEGGAGRRGHGGGHWAGATAATTATAAATAATGRGGQVGGRI